MRLNKVNRSDLTIIVVCITLSIFVAACSPTASAGATEPNNVLNPSGVADHQTTVYKVVRGDTLMGISRKYFNDDPQYWDEIADLNGIEAPYTIHPGQELEVPYSPTTSSPQQKSRRDFKVLSTRTEGDLTIAEVDYIEHTEEYCWDLCVLLDRVGGMLNDLDTSDDRVDCKCFPTEGNLPLSDTATLEVTVAEK